MVQIDLSAAFDRVYNFALFYKLGNFGVGDSVFSVISLLLSSGIQCVCIDDWQNKFCNAISKVL